MIVWNHHLSALINVFMCEVLILTGTRQRLQCDDCGQMSL